MSEEKKSFTIKDRRHFASDGSPRAGVAADEAPRQGPEPVRPVAEAGAPATLRPDAAPAPGGDDERVDLASFLISLATQASLLLDGRQPDGTRVAPDLEGARHMIGILEMLHDKTQGRRTPDEDRILDGLLYELRLAYVARARGARA